MNSKTIQHVLLLSFLLLPVVSLAQFKPLVGIPGISDPSTDINSYINILYALSISIAALLAVIKIIVAGVKYMLSDVVTSKSEAKSDIQGALIGLLVVISAVLILNIINPQLTQTTLFVGPVDSVPSNSSAVGGGGGGSPAPIAASPSIESCTYNSVTNSFDCSAATDSCVAKGGKPKARTNAFGSPINNSIECSYGETINIACERTADTSAPSGYTYQCITASADCTRSGGTGTVSTGGDTVTCYIPNKRSP